VITKTLAPLIVVADDYGIAPGVSRGIRELAEAMRLSGTGAMTTMPHWPEAAAALKPLAGKFAVGLHLTLTDQTPLGPMPILAPSGKLPSIATLTRTALLLGLPRNEIAAELDRQLTAFTAHFGRAPDFIDGHQHVHQLRDVRDAVVEVCATRLKAHGTWLRDCWDGLGVSMRRKSFEGGMVAWLGRGLHRSAQKRGVKTNHGFAGVYPFGAIGVGADLPRMLTGVGSEPLLMVHPGHPDAELAAVDGWVAPREDEWAYLMSGAFPQDLAKLGLRVATGAPFPG
jgi:hypothetical protein